MDPDGRTEWTDGRTDGGTDDAKTISLRLRHLGLKWSHDKVSMSFLHLGLKWSHDKVSMSFLPAHKSLDESQSLR